MYIRKTSRTYKGRTYTNYLLVESVVTPRGPRQKAICSLGDLSPRPKQDRLALAHKLESALSGPAEPIQPSADAELDRLVTQVKSSASAPVQRRSGRATAGEDQKVTVRVDGVRCEQSREAGPVHLGCQFWRRLDLDAILAQAGLSEGARRLTLAMPEWIPTTAFAGILGVDFSSLAEDALYRNLDQLHGRRVAIETALAERERNLFGLDRTVFCTTSLRRISKGAR